MKKVLIVEDEAVALEDLKDSLLEIIPSLEIVGAGNASEALEKISKFTFDVIFLDIDLPGMSGIQMLQRLPASKPPVVLVTGHAVHAVDAFGLGVSECLLKPIDQQRLRRCVDRIQSLNQSPDISTKAFQKTFSSQSHILIREGQKIYFFRINEISHFAEEKNATNVFFRDQCVLISRELVELKSLLKGEQFFCVSPGVYVNVDAIDQITLSPTGGLIAWLKTSKQLEFTSEQARAFEERYQL